MSIQTAFPETSSSEYNSDKSTQDWRMPFDLFPLLWLDGRTDAAGRQRALLTRLRQNGRPCAMMLMLKILRTFWGGNCSLATSLGSARSSGWSPGGTCEVSFPQTAVGIFLRAPDDEKRGIGQCRSIAERPFYCVISRNPRWMSGACCRLFLSQTCRYSPCWTSSPIYSWVASLLRAFKISSECDISVAPQPGGAAAFRPWEEDSPNQSVLPQTGAVESAPMTPLSRMRASSRPT